jgi:hypothetical protein
VALEAAYAAGDAAAAVALVSFDAVHEDMAAHCRLRGQLQIQRYYTRALGALPYGPGAALVHVIYDSSLLSYAAYTSLAGLAAEEPLS